MNRALLPKTIALPSEMMVTTTTIAIAESRCKQKGTRLTPKRKQLLKLLLEAEKALSAYELVDVYLEKVGSPLPVMTAYRTLEFLEEQGLVHKLKLANKYIACTRISDDHQHGDSQFLICKNCQKVEEIQLSHAAIDELKSNVKVANFHFDTTQIELSGMCNECQPKNNTDQKSK